MGAGGDFLILRSNIVEVFQRRYHISKKYVPFPQQKEAELLFKRLAPGAVRGDASLPGMVSLDLAVLPQQCMGAGGPTRARRTCFFCHLFYAH